MHKIIRELYDFDESDETYVIKISPDRYLDIFNKLDHYPIRKRDISADVIRYLEECSLDIPPANRIKIEITIKEEPPHPDMEERTRKGMRNYFLYELELNRRRSRKEIRTSVLFAGVFVLLTVATFGLETLWIDTHRIFFSTVLEGLAIGTWVFLWEAIAGVLIKNKRNRTMIRTYKRLLLTPLVFRYENQDCTDTNSVGRSIQPRNPRENGQ